MNDEKEVEALRKEIGEKMALDGDYGGVPADHASDSLKEGYRRAAAGWGTNVMPRNFGRTGNAPPDWVCTCGHINKGAVRFKVANRIVCEMCRVEKDVALEALKAPFLSEVSDSEEK